MTRSGTSSVASSESAPSRAWAAQYGAGEDGRPDLAAWDADGRLAALIEAKFWFGLMDTQPVAYLERLRSEGGSALLFVVPEERVPSIATELHERARKADPSLTAFSSSSGVHTARTSSGTFLKLTAWRHLLSVLTRACAAADDRAAAANLDQLSGLVSRFEAEGFGPMTGPDLTDLTVPRRVRAFVGLVQAVLEKGKETGLLTTRGCKQTHTWTSAGSYFALPSSYAWIGLDYDAWAVYHCSPLWLCFPVRSWCRAREVARALQPWEAATPRRSYVNDDDSVSVPLFIPAATEKDEVVEALLRQVQDVESALAAARLVRAGAPPPDETAHR